MTLLPSIVYMRPEASDAGDAVSVGLRALLRARGLGAPAAESSSESPAGRRLEQGAPRSKAGRLDSPPARCTLEALKTGSRGIFECVPLVPRRPLAAGEPRPLLVATVFDDGYVSRSGSRTARDSQMIGQSATHAFEPRRIGGQAPLVQHFHRMCQKSGLGRVLALALTERALETARGTALPRRALAFSAALSEYIASFPLRPPGLRPRWRAMNRAKLLLVATVAFRGYAPFCIELDVIVLKAPLAYLQPEPAAAPGDANVSFDLAAMYCPPTTAFGRNPLNRINMGFMFFNPTRSAAWEPFLTEVVTKSFGGTNKNVWEQNMFNAVQNCRAANECPGPPLLLKQLTICEPHPLWSNEEGIVPFANAARQLGGFQRAARKGSKVAIHVIGESPGGMPKLDWLRMILPELYSGTRLVTGAALLAESRGVSQK